MISSDSIKKSKFPIKTLGEVVDFLDSRRKPVKGSERKPGPFPYYGANGIQGTIDKFIFDESLILLAEDGGHFGNPEKTIAYQVDGKCWVNNHAHVLKPKNGVDIRFLCRQLEKYDVTPFVSGSTRGKLTKGAAERIPLIIPALPEQRRIATILDKADAIRRKRRQAIDLMNDFLQSVFLETFGDPQSNTKGWAKKRIEEIGKVVTGNTPSRANPEYYGNSVEWIKSDNINTSEHYLTKATEFLSEEGRAVGRTVPSGSVLVTCIAGSADCIGNSAIADREVAFNQQINAVIPNAECTVEFLYTLFLVSKRIIQAASTNSMKGMVSKSKFENIVIPVPPIDLQRKFSKCFDKINHSLRNLSASEKEVSYLNCSLSADLFDGAST